MTSKHEAPVVDDTNVQRNLEPASVSETQGPQMFTKEQLPDPAVAIAAGLAPQAIPAGQIIESNDDAFSHPRGPEPGEQVRAEQRRAVVDRVVQNDDVPGVDNRTLSKTAVEPEATTAVGKALQKQAEGDEDDTKLDEAGREIDPEGVQADSKELAEKKHMNDGDDPEDKGESTKDQE